MPAATKSGGVAAFGASLILLVSGCNAAPTDRRELWDTRAPSPAAGAATSQAPSTPAGSTPARPVNTRTPCTTNRRPRIVLVSLRRQHMWLCARARVAYSSAVTSGMAGPDTETPTGRYEIQYQVRNTSLTLIDGSSYQVKYWIPFDGPLFGFHDSSWQHFPYGSPRYRTAGSHGCIHLPLRAIRVLYRWAQPGTPVRIRA